MNKEIDACLTKIKKRIKILEDKDADLKKYCLEKWSVDWYGTLRWQEEYEKRHIKDQKELQMLRIYKDQIYNTYLALIEKGLEDGTDAERAFLGLKKEDADHDCSYDGAQ